MDDRGFIFTVDATLALIVVMVLTISISAYVLIPFYQGGNHQDLEALADSVLAVMEQDGTLTNAALMVESGDSAGARDLLRGRLNSLVPVDTDYDLTMVIDSTPISVNNTNSNLVSTDQVTKVKVISAPQEGWWGRAWYKIENFTFVEQPQNVTTTLWNFHNWLSNFGPWNSGNAVEDYYYWGDKYTSGGWWQPSTHTPVNINFSVPNGTYHNVKYLVGSDSYSSGNSYGATLNINGNTVHFDPNQSTFVGKRSSDSSQWMWNYLGNFSTNYLSSGNTNSFYLTFTNMSNHKYDLPWFSIIGNYTTSFLVPTGIRSNTSYFQDAAGLAVQSATNLDGKGGNEYGLKYDLSSGTVTPVTNKRVMDWDDFYNKNSNTAPFVFDDGTPFVITGSPISTRSNNYQPLTAVSTITDVNVPTGTHVLDSFVAVNAYGGMDGALVEVWNGTTWKTIFCSFDVGGVDYSGVSDGYGNTPGIIYIPSGCLIPGQNNKVRITTWDAAPGDDYDLVGLTDCYVTTMFTGLNVLWDDTPFNSYQSTSNTQTQTKSFTIGADAKEAYLFVSTGLDTQSITVKYSNNNKVLYSGSVPYYLDLASLDASKGYHIITTADSTGDSYNLTPGTYGLTVTVTSYKDGWESGDSNAEIFSGTRIGIIYPQTLYNEWAMSYGANVTDAEEKAKLRLQEETGVSTDKMSSDALYVGNMPNQIPVRLNLWK